MSFKRLLGTTLLAGAALALVATPGFANHSWGGYHWGRTANPFTVKLGDNVGSAWDSYLRTASTDWSQSTVLDTTVVTGRTFSPKLCWPTSGRVEVCNASYGSTGWLGIAQIWLSGTHISQGTTKLNDTYFNTATYNTPAWRALVTCQEVGHNFGLGHQDEDFTNTNLNTCMDYTSLPESNQHPNQHDYDQLVTIYSHADATTTVAATTAAAFGLDTGADWGRPVAYNRSGLADLFVKDFGGGRKRITHVFWLPDAKRGQFPHSD